MKKYLNPALILVEIIFAVLTVLELSYIIRAFVTFLWPLYQDGTDIGILFNAFYALGLYFLLGILLLASMTAAMHAFRKSIKGKGDKTTLPSAIALVSGVAAALPYFLIRLKIIDGLSKPFSYVCFALTVICTIICIASLIATAVISIKNKRRLKSAAQDEPAADAPDVRSD